MRSIRGGKYGQIESSQEKAQVSDAKYTCVKLAIFRERRRAKEVGGERYDNKGRQDRGVARSTRKSANE
jgi:hypothetical protein